MPCASTDGVVPINRPWLGKEEKYEVLRVLEENALTSAADEGGKRVQEFETALRNYLGSKHVLAVNSGTAALYATLLAANIRPGDEVLLPSFTFVATANAVVAAGGRPVFVDIKKDDFTLDPSALRAKITKRSKVVIPVHLYGHPCDMEVIEIANKHSLIVIEDACQSLGSTNQNRQTGTFGAMGCFSLYASKVLTAGEGGAIATDDDRLAAKIKMIRNHGRTRGHDTRALGLNLRLPEMSAAIAKVQTGKLTSMLRARRNNAEFLSRLLSETKGISLPTESDGKKFNWYLYTVAFVSSKVRDRARKLLEKAGIDSAVYYDPPVHKMPYYRNVVSKTKLAETDWSAKRVLSLPVHPGVLASDVERMAASFADL